MKNITKFTDLYAFSTERKPIDLSLSENPLGCSPKVVEVLKQAKPTDVFDYPDPSYSQLRLALAKKFNLKESNFFIGNGSEAVIKLLAEALVNASDEVIIPELTFTIFRIVATLQRAKIVFSKVTDRFDIDLADIKKRATEKTKLIFLCNPNNPTGKLLDRKEILNFVASIKATVVVDEANIEFGGESVVKATAQFSNLIVLRTFSKGYGLAGMRIGYAVADESIIFKLKQLSPPFPTSVLAEKAALVALADDQFLEKTKNYMDRERKFLTSKLRSLGLKVVDSKSNNLLLILPKKPLDFIDQLNQQGVSVIDGSSFGFSGPRFIRISPRLREINQRFIEVVKQIVS